MKMKGALLRSALIAALGGLLFGFDTAVISGAEGILRELFAERYQTTVVLLMAAVGLVLLAALGLYGVLAYYVSRRSHEIGIRVALGADAGQVIRPILQRGLSLVAAGIFLGLVGAFWAARILQRLLFDVAPTDAATFVFVGLFFAVVALVACLLPALRALKVDPVTALAAE